MSAGKQDEIVLPKEPTLTTSFSALIFKSGNETNLLHQLGELTEVKKSSAFFLQLEYNL